MRLGIQARKNFVLLFNSYLVRMRDEADDNTRCTSSSASVQTVDRHRRIVKLE